MNGGTIHRCVCYVVSRDFTQESNDRTTMHRSGYFWISIQVVYTTCGRKNSVIPRRICYFLRISNFKIFIFIYIDKLNCKEFFI